MGDILEPMQEYLACQVKPALFRPDQSQFPGVMVVMAAFPEGGGVIIFIFFPRGNPVKFTDPDGRTGEYVINDQNKTITIRVDIILYGQAATDALASDFENLILDELAYDHNGNAWKMRIGANDYQVDFQVNVRVGEEPGLFSKWWNKNFGTTNFIEIDPNISTPVVIAGYMGKWRSSGRNGLSLKQDNTPAHEFGHLLGFRDKYDYKTQLPLAGWSNDLMGTMAGKVQYWDITAMGSYISGQRAKHGIIRSKNMDLY
jgi:hypothetical protein